MHNLSLGCLSWWGVPPAQAIRMAAEIGYESVGIRARPLYPSDEGHVSLLTHDPARVRQVKDALQAHGVCINEVETARMLPETDARTFEPLIAVGAELGARSLLVTSEEGDVARNADVFLEICELSQAYGLYVALEFMPYRSVSSLAQAVRVVLQSEHPNASVLVDLLHLTRSGGVPAEIAAFDPGLFRFAQVTDAPAKAPKYLRAEAAQSRLLPGDGELPVAEFVSAFHKDVLISVEAPLLRESDADRIFRRLQRGFEQTQALLNRVRGSEPKTSSVPSAGGEQTFSSKAP